MCQGCTFSITTGRRHFCEYILCPELLDVCPQKDRLMDKAYGKNRDFVREPKWINAQTSESGIKIMKLESNPDGNPLSYLRNNIRAIRKEFTSEGKKEFEKLLREYNKPKLDLDVLFRIKNPVKTDVFYFRQILVEAKYILIANNFAGAGNDILKIYGNPKKLAGIIRKLHDAQGLPADDFISNYPMFEKIVSQHGLIKFMPGFYFAVIKGEDGEIFSFGQGGSMLERIVKEAVEGKLKDIRM